MLKYLRFLKSLVTVVVASNSLIVYPQTTEPLEEGTRPYRVIIDDSFVSTQSQSFLNLLQPARSYVREDANSDTQEIGIYFPVDRLSSSMGSNRFPSFPGRNITSPDFPPLSGDGLSFSDRTLCLNDEAANSQDLAPRECVSGYRSFFPLKSDNEPRPNQPFEFIQLAWNPLGKYRGV